MISGLYRTALDCGVSPCEFWEYSPGEVTDIIESFVRKEKNRTKEKLMYNYQLATYIKLFVGSLLSKDIEVPELYDMYPEIFKDERKSIEKEKIEKELKLHKERMRQFAIRHNQNRYK